jgi:hypothetical protein
MKYAVEMASDGKIYILSLIKFKNVKVMGEIHRQTAK